MVKLSNISRPTTFEDMIRRYNLDSLSSSLKVVKSTQSDLTKVENQLNNFVLQTTQDIEDLQNQIDGNITTWFYSGTPTADNEPAVNWTTEEDKTNHIGDLYYDKDTGYSYRWTLDSGTLNYSWIKLTDADITEALSVANKAQDTADSKRRVFVKTPTPPYDVGDIWLKDNSDMYRCQLGRDEKDTFNFSDWIIATKYTDDTGANEAKAQLSEYKTYVSDTYETQADFIKEKDALTLQVNAVETRTTTLEDGLTLERSASGYPVELVHAGEYELQTNIVAGNSTQNGTPTPTAPIDIKSVGTVNLFNIEDFELTESGVTIKKEGDLFTINGTATANIGVKKYKSLFTDAITGKYYINKIYVSGTSTVTYSNISLRDASSESAIISTYLTSKNTSTSTTLTNQSVMYGIWIESGAVFDNLQFKLQLTKYNENFDFVPYGNNIVEYARSKNLYNKDKFIFGYITSSGTLFEDTTLKANALSDYIPLIPNTDYIFSANSQMEGLNVAFFDSNRNYVSRQMSAKSTKNTFNSGTNSFARVWANYNGATITSDILEEKGVQLEVGSTASTYEAYNSNKLVYNIGSYELNKIGTVYDELDIAKGLLTKRIGKIVLNGTESWGRSSIYSTDDYLTLYINDDKYTQNADCLSDTLKPAKTNSLQYGTDNFIGFAGKSVNVRISTSLIGGTTLNDFKTWLASNNTTLYYPLKETETIQLDKADLVALDGYNLISLDSEVSPTNMSIEYLTNTVLNEQYVSNAQLQVSNAKIEELTSKTTTIDNNYIALSGKVGEIDTLSGEITQVKNTVQTVQDEASRSLSIATEIQQNGATKLRTETDYTFDADGLKINKTNGHTSSKLDEEGLAIYEGNTSDDNVILYAGYDEKYSSSVLKTQKMIINDKLRFENFTTDDSKEAVGCFWVGD